ncbi:hypothetical protein D3C73_745170 [compost metagenome]
MAIPAIDSTLFGHKPLAGLQRCHQALRVTGGGDPDLRQCAGKFRRGRNTGRQRLNAIRQARIVGAVTGHRPITGGRVIDRAFEIVPESCTKCRLVTALDMDHFGNRYVVA